MVISRIVVMGVVVLLVAGCTKPPQLPPEPAEPESSAAEPSRPEPSDQEPSDPEPSDPDFTFPAPVPIGEGWFSLFDGRSLDGWKAAENADSFSIDAGLIVVHGPRAHLYYVGDVENHDFKNFEFRADVMTTPGSNSGIYFHTRYQETDWPLRGYESQVNHSYGDAQKTGSLYDVSKVAKSPVADNVWFTQRIIVQGKRVIVKVNDETLVDYTEPENPERPPEWSGRRLSSGTFALQAHDPDSKVYFANILVKPLPD